MCASRLLAMQTGMQRCARHRAVLAGLSRAVRMRDAWTADPEPLVWCFHRLSVHGRAQHIRAPDCTERVPCTRAASRPSSWTESARPADSEDLPWLGCRFKSRQSDAAGPDPVSQQSVAAVLCLSRASSP